MAAACARKDLSRVDQADGARPVCRSRLPGPGADAAQAALAAWGVQAAPTLALADEAEPEPPVPDATAAAAQHPAAADWQDQAEVARRAADLAAVQTRANPELTVAATRGREQAGDRYQQTFTVGLRIPLGGGDRAQAKQATARADLAAEARRCRARPAGRRHRRRRGALEGTQAQRDALGTPRGAGAGHTRI